MTTFDTYQQAKLQYPNDYILFSNVGKFHAASGAPELRAQNGWRLCKPRDWCITVYEFLDGGDRFSDGDWYIENDGSVNKVNNEDLRTMNELNTGDNDRYILRAAALENKMNIDKLETQSEEQPKSVKYEYKEISFHKCHEAMFKHEMEERLYVKGEDEFEMATIYDVVDKWHFGLYRKIETEITERDAIQEILEKSNTHPIDEPYIEVNGDRITIDGTLTTKEIHDIGKLFDDSGKFKLTN